MILLTKSESKKVLNFQCECLKPGAEGIEDDQLFQPTKILSSVQNRCPMEATKKSKFH